MVIFLIDNWFITRNHWVCKGSGSLSVVPFWCPKIPQI